MFLSFITGFGICPDTAIAKSLFTFAMAYDPALSDYLGWAFLLALIQWPIYGLMFGVALMRGRSNGSWPLFCAIIILALHLVAVAKAKSRVDAMWAERFSHIGQAEL